MSPHGRALGFHVLTENGAVIWRLPLHAFCHRPDAPPQPLDWLQFWDCFRLTNTRCWKVERETETTQGFFYDDSTSGEQPSQVELYAKVLRV